MAAVGALFGLFLLVSLALGLGLYWLVRAEARDREVMERSAAEQRARRDDDREL